LNSDTIETLGIIFPFLPEHVNRFFNDGKTVFVKFYGKGSTPIRLHVGSTLFFYESRGSKRIVGEAEIREISSRTADKVVAEYGDSLFLTQKELDEYANQRSGRKMLVLVLKDVRLYKTPLRLRKSVTMAGQYMTKLMFDELRAAGHR
jgi:hypothetical protein